MMNRVAMGTRPRIGVVRSGNVLYCRRHEHREDMQKSLISFSLAR
jgi:hypothetical protein